MCKLYPVEVLNGTLLIVYIPQRHRTEMSGEFLKTKQALPTVGLGLGLRSDIAEQTFSHPDLIRWVEFAPENYTRRMGVCYKLLQFAASRMPVIPHGVSLNIGGTDELDWDFLREIKSLFDEFDVPWWSDHLCFSRSSGVCVEDLFPLPHTKKSVRNAAERIKRAQDFIGRPMLIENISTYMVLPDAEMSESQFVAEVLEMADCGLLLDVNNVYVSSINQDSDPWKFLDELPVERTVQIHIAGHHKSGAVLVDTHGAAVIEPVFQLLEEVLRRTHVHAIMIERDQDFFDFEALLNELVTIKSIMDDANYAENTDGKPLEVSSRKPDETIVASSTDESSNGNGDKNKKKPSKAKTSPAGEFAEIKEIQDTFLTFVLTGGSNVGGTAKYPRMSKDVIHRMDRPRAELYVQLMKSKNDAALLRLYPNCRKLLADSWFPTFQLFINANAPVHYYPLYNFESFPDFLEKQENITEVLPFIAGLARLEWFLNRPSDAEITTIAAERIKFDSTERLRQWCPVVNPSIHIFSSEFRVMSILTKVENGQNVDIEAESEPGTYAVFDRLNGNRDVVIVSDLAREVIECARSGGTYATILKTICSANKDARKGADILKILDTLQSQELVLGSSPAVTTTNN
ncbi:MAG: DUF692 domain-containing protein [Cyanobacteria bacterium]|nr:DUF692 domain-containing protein [Cyanobacteriota bacterium]